jgi:hypothetical protein
VSVLPLPQAADHERVRDEQIIGDKRPRDARGCDDGRRAGRPQVSHVSHVSGGVRCLEGSA